MRSTKRVILANGSRLLREILHRAIDQADQLEVMREIPDWGELPASLQQFHPAWVIVPEPYGDHPRHQIDSCMNEYPSVRFIFLSPTRNSVRMKWQVSCEAEYPDLSLEEFIHLLEKDLQHT